MGKRQRRDNHGDFLESLFQEAGMGVISVSDGSMICAESDHFYFRVLIPEEKIQIACRSSFDRWANSVDFWAKMPRTVEDLALVASTAESALRDPDLFSDGFGKELEIVIRRGQGKVLLS